ncbi:RrF2 family transcriptional regulator [Fusobacterium sp.]|uniref:RrF2 family transcriptional regulator n=1 Tax=Fusobacterium sp. TaxID=68766 RepID=UPI002903BD40|nr:Rrf2 family transcriptional regulator [Fusobacterium sp.]MDU1909855.1 Rrf2 family transcriptional regulator [Fusobacterium sp.]
MKITQETNCAIKAILYLSTLQKSEVSSAKVIGKFIEFSDKFVLKVLRPLTSANIVLPFRGVTGGYCLKKTIDKISLFDVIIAVQNDINILTVMKNMSKKDIKKDEIFSIFEQIQEFEKKVLKKITFDMIINNKVSLKSILEITI